MAKKYQELAIKDPTDFLFGVSPYPVSLKNGSPSRGEGQSGDQFSPPGMGINPKIMPEVRDQYALISEM